MENTEIDHEDFSKHYFTSLRSVVQLNYAVVAQNFDMINKEI